MSKDFYGFGNSMREAAQYVESAISKGASAEEIGHLMDAIVYINCFETKYGKPLMPICDIQTKTTDCGDTLEHRTPALLFFSTAEDARAVLVNMISLAHDYGFVSLMEYYDLAACSNLGVLSDRRYGWGEAALMRVEVNQVHGEYMLNLPYATLKEE